MQLEELIKINAIKRAEEIRRLKRQYENISYKGKNYIEWTRIWFKTDNDTFFKTYGFNFNPHKYAFLYEIVRDEIIEEAQREYKKIFQDA